MAWCSAELGAGAQAVVPALGASVDLAPPRQGMHLGAILDSLPVAQTHQAVFTSPKQQ